jgi:hypothetical protein
VNIEQAKTDILTSGLSDWVGFGEVAWAVSKQLPATATRDEKISLASATIRSLLEDDLIRVGDPVNGRKFVAWDLSIDETIRRIEAEWRALPEEPSIGYVCWFENTERGSSLAMDSFESIYLIRHGKFSVWLTVDPIARRLDFKCTLDIAKAGKIVGVEILDFCRQLEGATVAPVRGEGDIHWTCDPERDSFYLRVAPEPALVRKKTSGRARLDDQHLVIGMEVVIPKANTGGPT